jgi:photosystem II stability/assembly factor-like uncharacterized protein
MKAPTSQPPPTDPLRGASPSLIGRTAAALVLVLLACLAMSTAARAAGTWSAQTSLTPNNLMAVSCPDASHCWAAGALGTIISTTNGGTTWTPQISTTTAALDGIACPNTSNCWTVDTGGGITATTNGGTTWAAQASTTAKALYAISCVDAQHCWAVGDLTKPGSGTGTIVATTNGGTTWTAQSSNAGKKVALFAISCVDSQHCWAAGTGGAIVATTDGGTTWATQTSATASQINGLSCTSTSSCWAVDAGGAITATANGGSSWTSETSGTTQALSSISCLSAGTSTSCFAVGATSTALATTNAGAAWSAQATGAPAGSQFNSVSAGNPGRAWVVANGGLIYAYAGSCSTGSLGLSGPSSISLPGKTITGSDQTAVTTAVLTPDDETAFGLGWSINATSTQFANAGGKLLPASATTITGASASAAPGNCTLPTNAISYPVGLPAGASPPPASKVYDAAIGSGGGPTDVTLNTQLAIPGNAFAGSYSSTWTFTIASGP